MGLVASDRMTPARAKTKSQTLRAARIAVDVAMAVVFVRLMATAIADDVAHEWQGVAAFALVVAHLVLNRRFLLALPRGAYTPVRVVRTCADALLLVCIVGLVASSLVLSQHAFGWLPALPGTAWARPVHMLASYWGFLLAFAHAGLHVPRSLAGGTTLRKAVWAVACASLVAVGVWAAGTLGVLDCLLLQTQFVFVDPAQPVWERFALYALVGAGALAAGHAGACAPRPNAP